MPYATYTYTATAGQTDFTAPPYRFQNEIKVYRNGVLTTDWTWFTSSVIRLNTGASEGEVIRVQRVTQRNAREVDFQPGPIRSEDLDRQADQNFYNIQELWDTTEDTLKKDYDGVWNADNKRIKNVANPTADQDAATKGWVETVWSADLNAAVNNAQTSANNAAISANNASNSAAAAQTSANNAAASANNAAASASDAEASATAAQNAAAGVNLPSISSADAGKILSVKTDGSQYVLSSSSPDAGDYMVFDGTLWVPSRPTPRNIVWQGNMMLWQEAPSGYTGVGSAGRFINDGWAFGSGGLTTGRCSITPDNNNNAPPGKSASIVCTTAQSSIGSSEYVHVNARLEGFDLAVLGYGTTAAVSSNLSIRINCVGHTGTYTFFVWVGDGTNSYAYKFKRTLSSGWNYIQQTIPAFTAFQPPRDSNIRGIVGVVLAAGSGLTDTSEEAWTNYSSGFRPGLSGQNNFFSSTSYRIDIASVQWTPGPYPLPFLDRPIAETLAIAQRYYEKSYALGTSPGTAVLNGAVIIPLTNNSFVPGVRFAVRKRATPTITLYSPVTGASGYIRNYSADADQAHGTINAGESAITYFSRSGTSGDAIGYHWVADARV